jgi:hypothetical protein
MPQRTKAFPQKAKQAIREVRILAFLSRGAYQLDVCAKSQARLLNHAVKFRDAVLGRFPSGRPWQDPRVECLEAVRLRRASRNSLA